MRSLTTLSVLSLFLLAGCSLLNAPDRNRITQDGGPADVVVADGGLDAPDVPDVFDGGTDARPELCDEVGDEDGDGLSDCTDPDCAGDSRCCTDGEAENIGFEDGNWTLIGTRELDGTRLVFAGATPSVYVNNSCYALSRGAVFAFDAYENTTIDCENDVCDDFVAIYLSSVRTAAPDSRIVAELGVTIRAGRAELYRGRDNLVETMDEVTIPNNGPMRVVVRVAPVVVDGEAVLRATVTVGGVQFTETPLIPQGDLIQGCRDGISGLYYGVEGLGRRLELESSAAFATTLECTNPTQFTSSDCLPVTANGSDPLVSLGWPLEGEDITHPELVYDNGTSRWHIYGSTSSQQLEFSYLPDFPWSMAHSSTRVWDEDSEWVPQEVDVVGREPTVAFRAAGSELVHFGIIGDQIQRCTDICTPIAIECEGLANPSLALTPEGNFVLFYQCGFGADQEVWLHALAPGLGLSTVPATVVLRASDFGPLARNGLVDFDVLLDARGGEDNPEYLIRAWVVGEALGNVRTLLLATGAMKLPSLELSGTEELEVLEMGVSLVPYPANPIATENVLFRDPNQSLQGVSVEHTENPRDLLFLFGRRTERPEGRLYDFVPIEQTWGTL